MNTALGEYSVRYNSSGVISKRLAAERSPSITHDNLIRCFGVATSG